MEAVSGKDIS